MKRITISILLVFIFIMLFQVFPVCGQEEQKGVEWTGKLTARLVNSHIKLRSGYINALDKFIKGLRHKQISKILNVNIRSEFIFLANFFTTL